MKKILAPFISLIVFFVFIAPAFAQENEVPLPGASYIREGESAEAFAAAAIATAAAAAEATVATETVARAETSASETFNLSTGSLSRSTVQSATTADDSGSDPRSIGGDGGGVHSVPLENAKMVGSSGAFTYSYPISLPPGTNGMGPALSLSYNSFAGDGMLGMGFSLSGLSVIARDPSYPIKFDGTDHYLYEGQKLIYGSDGYYHTERESFVRIKAYSLDTASAYWTVTMKNGTKLHFGATSDSCIDAVGKAGKARLWALSKVEDVHGNYYDIEYMEDTANGDYYPLRINYTKGNGLVKFRTVEFSYEARTDHFPIFAPTKVDADYRMKWITVKVGGILLRKYRIDYGSFALTGRSQVVGVQEYGSDGDFPNAGVLGSYMATGSVLPAISFQWYADPSLFSASGPFELGADPYTTEHIAGDVDGDGRADLIEFRKNGANHTAILWRSSGSGFSQWNTTVLDPDTATVIFKNFLVLDVNGDGRSDVVARSQNGTKFNAVVWISAGNSFTKAGNGTEVGTYRDDTHHMALDVDGDGRMDLVERWKNSNSEFIATVWLSDGAGFRVAESPKVGDYRANSEHLVLDVDGDGRTDLVEHWKEGTKTTATVWLSTGNGFKKADDIVLDATATVMTPLVLDVNGDGKTDLVERSQSGGVFSAAVWLSNGTGFLKMPSSNIGAYDSKTMHFSLDTNGDGKTDIVQRWIKETNGVLSCWITVFISTGNGFTQAASVDLGSESIDAILLPLDANGDGWGDIVARRKAASKFTVTLWNSVYMPHGIYKVGMVHGGEIYVSYSPAPQMSGAVTSAFSAYPIISNKSPRALVSSIVYDPKIGVPVIKTFEYTQGYMYMGKPYERTDLGFQVFCKNVKQPDGTYQTDRTIFGGGASPEERKWYAGLPVLSLKNGADGKLYSVTSNYYSSSAIIACEGSRFVCLRESTTTDYNGDTDYTNAVSKKRVFYYSQYGDPSSVLDLGDFDLSNGDIFQDRVDTVTEYAVNTTAWIIAPIRQSVYAYDLSGSFGLATEKRFFYYNGSTDNDFFESIAPSYSIGVKGLVAQIRYENGTRSTTEQFAYYPNGSLWKNKDARNIVSRLLTYDDDYATLVRKETNALAQIRENIYDPLMRLQEVKNAAGISSNFRYDMFGRMKKIWGYGDTETSPTKNIYYYDIANFPEKPAYIVEEMKDTERWYTHRSYFDGLGRTIQTKSIKDGHYYTWLGIRFFSSEYVVVDTHFDAAGRVSKTSLPWVTTNSDFRRIDRDSVTRKHIENYYDPIGRPYWTKDADGTNTYILYGSKYQAAVDGEGRVTATEIVGNKSYAYSYNLLDYSGYALYADIKQAFSASIGSYYRRVTTHNARNGTIIAEKSGSSATENIITVYKDMLGRKTSYTDPDKGTWTYDYDPNGNMIHQKDAKNNIIRFDYDLMNRPSTKKNGSTVVSSYSYTNIGQLYAVNHSSGNDVYFYDQRGNMTQINRTITGYGTKTILMKYDSMGRVVTQTYPDGEVVTNKYDPGSNLDTVKGTSSYVTNIDYNSWGKVTSLTYGNGKTTIYGFEYLNGRMTDMDVSGVVDFNYGYDLAGNIVRKTDNLNGINESFVYDGLHRLTSAIGGGYGTKSYAYDEYNNITNKDGKVFAYSGVGGIKPHAVSNVGVNIYTYDGNGNMVGGTIWNFIYDFQNRATSITKSGITTFLKYDDSGERITKTVGNTVNVYWFPIYEEKYVNGTLTDVTKFYSANGLPVAQRSTANGLLYIHKDHLGSATKLTNESGSVVQSIGYDPYGAQASASGGTYTQYKYTGQEEDASTGLYYYHARYYDPLLGRFLQADTVLDGMNRYAYCGNNPVMYTDPTGLKIIKEDDKNGNPIIVIQTTGTVINTATGESVKVDDGSKPDHDSPAVGGIGNAGGDSGDTLGDETNSAPPITPVTAPTIIDIINNLFPNGLMLPGGPSPNTEQAYYESTGTLIGGALVLGGSIIGIATLPELLYPGGPTIAVVNKAIQVVQEETGCSYEEAVAKIQEINARYGNGPVSDMIIFFKEKIVIPFEIRH